MRAYGNTSKHNILAVRRTQREKDVSTNLHDTVTPQRNSKHF